MAEIYYEPTGCNCDGENLHYLLFQARDMFLEKKSTDFLGTSYSQSDINAAASRTSVSYIGVPINHCD